MKPTLQRLKQLIAREERLYESFLKLMKAETTAIEKFTPEKLESLAEKRQQSLLDIAAAVDARVELQNEILADQGMEPGENSRLSEVVGLLPKGTDRTELARMAANLKKIAKEVQVKATELNRLVGWSMSVVNGSISIIRSGAEDEVESYSRKGASNKSYHPKYGRQSVRLKEA